MACVRPLLRGAVGGTREPETRGIGSKLTWAGGAQLPRLWGCTLAPRRREGVCSRDLPGILLSSRRLLFVTFPPQTPSTLGLSTSPTVTPPSSLLHSRPWSPLPHELVVFSQAFRPAGSTRLYL